MKNHREFVNGIISHLESTGNGRVLEFLRKFSPLSEEQSAMIHSLLEVRHFDKKTILLEAGEVDDYLNMVVRGMVRKYIRRGKNEFILQLATEGHIIDSEISFIRRQPSEVVLETIEPSMLVSITYDNLEYIMGNMPDAERIGRLMLTDMFMKKDERHYKQLQLSTRERFLEYVENHPHMLQRVPQKYLASYLNIKPETFSRLKHLLRQNGQAECHKKATG